MIDPRLKDYSMTARQREVVQAVIDHGSNRKAASALGSHSTTIDAIIKLVKRRAADAGYSPEHDLTHPLPPGQQLHGATTLYGSEGELKLQWIKTRADDQARLEMIEHAVNVLAEDVKGLAKPIKPPKLSNKKLMTVYPMGDPHIGMFSWAKETGDDFDTKIARRDLGGAMTHLVDCAPPSDVALITNVGDFFHMDNSLNRTQQTGNILDVDTRWPQVLELGILAMRDCIDLALRKHKQVVVINAIGNHDEHSSVMLSANIAAFYHDEGRLTVIPTTGFFNYYEFGKCLIGVTHGDKAKIQTLDGVMAADQPEAWGRTSHRYWYTGHIHHISRLELKGCVAESFRTLAAKDSWNTSMGYRSGRDMNALVLHQEFGEVARHRCDISMLS